MKSQILYYFVVIFAHLFSSGECQRLVNNVIGSLFIGKEVQPGNVITIKGIFSENEYRTNIDLENRAQCKWETNYTSGNDCIIALHNSIRFDEHLIVRNFYKNEYENGLRFGYFPFKKGQKFTYKIIVNKDNFEIETDGKRFATFDLKTSLSNIKYVTIYGDAGIESITVEGSMMERDNELVKDGSLNNKAINGVINVNNVVGSLHLGKELHPGNVIVIKGTFSKDEYRTNIDLENHFKCKWEEDERKSTDPDCIVAFQNSIRFDENTIVRNYYKNVWDEKQEERDGEFPVQKGQDFIYKINVKENHFEVEINGKIFTMFMFRTALSNIKYVTIYGDSGIRSIEIVDATIFDDEPKKVSLEETLTINDETGSLYIHNELHPGSVITINGVFSNNSLISNIDLENNRCEWKNNRLTGVNHDCLVAFHTSIRFDERQIVRNSYQNVWDNNQEERHGEFPFQKGQQFVLKIFVKENHFEVEIDGKKFTTFNYRMPLSVIKYVKIYGNILVKSISVKKHMTNDELFEAISNMLELLINRNKNESTTVPSI